MNTRKTISHDQAIELLPWLLTGSMDEDEKQKVREHARSCVICRRELQELELINNLIADAAKAGPIPPPDMRNINARIDRLIEKRGRMRELISRLGARVLNPWRLAFALQTVLVIVLAAVLLWPASENAEYTTLTQSQTLPDGHHLRVVLDPDMPISELADLLAGMNLTVADGPSARGVYTLGVPQSLSQDSRDRLLARLQQNPKVLFAQWVAHR